METPLSLSQGFDRLILENFAPCLKVNVSRFLDNMGSKTIPPPHSQIATSLSSCRFCFFLSNVTVFMCQGITWLTNTAAKCSKQIRRCREAFKPRMVLFTGVTVSVISFPTSAWRGVHRPWQLKQKGEIFTCQGSISQLFWRHENAGQNVMYTSFHGHFS